MTKTGGLWPPVLHHKGYLRQFSDTPKMQDFIHDTIYYLLLWRLLFLFGGEYVKLIKADCRIFVKAKTAFGFISMENTNASKVAEGGT
jgi:hypothetical protein